MAYRAVINGLTSSGKLANKVIANSLSSTFAPISFNWSCKDLRYDLACCHHYVIERNNIFDETYPSVKEIPEKIDSLVRPRLP